MSVILGSTGITFPDATTQTTAATAGGNIQSAIFTTSTTWTAPANVTKVYVICVGGGGGCAYNVAGCGYIAYGAGGGIAVASVTVVPGTVYTITIGAGGASASGNSAGAITAGGGGTTSFGSLVTATGAGASYATNANAVSGSPGSGSTTGTLIRSTGVTNVNGINYPTNVAGPLNGFNIALQGPSGAQTWTTSSYAAAGSGGTWNGSPYGGTSGGAFIQYVG